MAKTIGQLDPVTTFNPSTDEFVIEQSGQTFKVAASVVRGGLVNANIDGAAAIAFSKLAALDSANILVGNGSNVATKVAVTGDVTISNAGVTAIGNDKVVTAKILDANVTPAKLSQPYTLATAQNSTSGTSIDFTGIPSWAKRITVMFNEVSTNGGSSMQVQLGTSGGFETSSYVCINSVIINSTALASAATSGFVTNGCTTSETYSGSAIISLVSSNAWTFQSMISRVDASAIAHTVGSKSLSGTLDRVRITTVNGTDDFDAGEINISYEG